MTTIKVPIIRNDEDLAWAHARLEELADAAEGSRGADEFEVLATIAHAYEAKHHAIEPPDPIGAIKETMFQLGMKQRDLVPYMGSEAHVSQVLSGKRALTVAMIRKLHEGLRIPLACLIGSSSQGEAYAG